MSGVGDIEDVGSSLGWEDPPGGKHGNPPQYSCLENPMDKEARQAIIIALHKVGHDKWLSTHAEFPVKGQLVDNSGFVGYVILF